MKPLIFLTVRTIVNGFRRAITSPRRLIGVLALGLYWFNFLIRSFTGARADRIETSIGISPVTLPSNHVIDGVLFGIFSLFSLFLLAGSASIRGGFRPADIDVLFPTPISPKLVLVFRIVRDAFLTLLVPLILAVVARPAALPIESFIRNHPAQGQFITKAATVAWFLLVIAWTCLSYAVSLFVNRSDERSDRNKRILEWGAGTFLLAAVTYVAIQLRQELSLATADRLVHDPIIRVAFFTASMATAAAMAPFTGNLLLAVLGFGGLLTVIAGSFVLAMSQVDYLYDQAAAKGIDNATMKSLQRSGDTYGMLAQRARTGKLRGGKIAEWISRFEFRGPGALLWKELLLQSRTVLWTYVVFLPVVLLIVVLPTWGVNRTGEFHVERGMFLGFMGFSVYMLSLNAATTGFIEFLRRVDFQKPLPFTSTVTVFWEVVPKVLPTFLICGIASLVTMALDLRMWDYALGAALMAPTLSLVLVAVVLLVTVLFPDIEDPTQRSFRGIMMMLGCLVASSPMLVVTGVLLFMRVNCLIIAIPAVAINIGVSLGVSALAGGLYSNFNPTD